ncbi:hypothetical protein GUJ93_ZPchr0002g25439 [Zizania palustris]|uniref:GST N-terminal domain-containing protein n=1 Tax=Zizania palustris TaxID=103762 RepID=A0A8J5S4D0_ZIZPA|nr:hypothetical protein GUJ93_ZPchr0002g25439 [Zizania palustris]
MMEQLAIEGEKQPGVVLLNCSASPFNNRVGNALTRKGVAYEEKLENLPAISSLLFSSNPILAQILVLAQIPILIVDGKPVYAKVPECAVKVWRSPAGAAGLAAMEGSKGLVAVRTLEAELGGRRYIDSEALGYVDVALVPLMTPWSLTSISMVFAWRRSARRWRCGGKGTTIEAGGKEEGEDIDSSEKQLFR